MHCLTDEEYDEYFADQSPIPLNLLYPVIVVNPSGLFFFYDEIWTDMYGPYDTYVACKNAMLEYNKTL